MQGPLFQKIHLRESQSFNILKVQRPYFVVPWHFHPEIEIMLVIDGKGTRFVGDSIESFKPYDLVMIGSNLAHVWKNGDEHYEENGKHIAEARVILFQEDCFGKEFFLKPEMKNIRDLIIRAGRGLKFEGTTRETIVDEMLASYYKEGALQFISLINILHKLADSKEYSYLCSSGYNQKVQASDLPRLNGVLDFLMKNYRKDIKLEEVAAVANMSVTAFCRYFKSRTNKTVIQFINELRVGYAHKLLVETQLNVERICFESGFNNVSNFYEQFQKISLKSPHKFRKEHNQKISHIP